jgi:hypothetical protein
VVHFKGISTSAGRTFDFSLSPSPLSCFPKFLFPLIRSAKKKHLVYLRCSLGSYSSSEFDPHHITLFRIFSRTANLLAPTTGKENDEDMR